MSSVYFVPPQTVTTPRAVQQVPVVSQPPGKPEKKKTGKRISFAETTKISIDDTIRGKLEVYGNSTLKSWTGKSALCAAKSISVRDLRIINEEAGTDVIDLNAENIKIVTFTIDSVIRERLKDIPNLSEPCRALGFSVTHLSEIKRGRSDTVNKERADAYNGYFKWDLFDWKRIFQLAVSEPISKKEKKLSERTWITIEDEHRKELNLLLKDPRQRERLTSCLGRGFADTICKTQIDILVIDAVRVHKISGKIIFTFNKQALKKLPILPAHLKELKSFIQKIDSEGIKIDATIRHKIRMLEFRNQITITREFAEELNSLVGKNVFDFDSILGQVVKEAETEAQAEVEALPLFSSSKKRSRTNGSSGPKPKKQRTDTVSAAPQPCIPAPLVSLPQTKPSFTLRFILNEEDN